MAIEAQKYIWLDGEFLSWESAQTHLVTHTLHYGLGAFEGIRCYPTFDGGRAIFRLQEHIRRLYGSCRICQIDMTISPEELTSACVELVKKNDMNEAYLRPIAFLGGESLGIGATDTKVHVGVVAWVFRAPITEQGVKEGIRAKISSFIRGGLNTLLAKGKICGHYVISVLARKEAALGGYDEALFLDATGHVAEGSGENIFVVRHGKLCTPPLSSAILEGITRDTVICLANDLHIPVEEVFLTRDELYLADEVFLTGTAAEITPVKEVDNRLIGDGKPGPITKKLQEVFFEVVHGKRPLYAKWLTQVR